MQGKIVITHYNKLILAVFFDDKDHPFEINVLNDEDSLLGNIYNGKVKNIVKNINAAFVEIEGKRRGYLAIDSLTNPVYLSEKKDDLIKCNDELLVQISRDAVKTKEAVLTTNINLSGKYCVLVANKKDLSISKKINDDQRKDELKNLVKPYVCDEYSFVVRTNAEGADNEKILNEIENLVNKWQTIKTKAKHSTAFSLIHSDSSPLIKLLRNIYDGEISKIITDDVDIYKEISAYYKSEDAENVIEFELYEDKMLPLVKLYAIEKAVESLYQKRVWLKSGGYLIVEPCEALTVIDVNSGKDISKKDKSKESLKINKEAAFEISRQLRLRNISGIVMIDFINMDSDDEKNELLKYFNLLIKKDPVQTTLVDITKLGIVELTRKKIKKPVYELITDESMKNA